MNKVPAFTEQRPEAAEWTGPSYLPDARRAAKQYGPTVLDWAAQAVTAIGMIVIMLIGCII